ncbi:hypothetical protein DPMN_095689 [Dreissena polymorpha]|uniref:Uncharacterized protein n=1 Tax=Dreissena polymorpha TaxID=45954 RepID=A0A9D4L9U7_DREPO|nr:hypothetical protein DPMN_095689 [Dreissena polymorpha]
MKNDEMVDGASLSGMFQFEPRGFEDDEKDFDGFVLDNDYGQTVNDPITLNNSPTNGQQK